MPNLSSTPIFIVHPMRNMDVCFIAPISLFFIKSVQHFYILFFDLFFNKSISTIYFLYNNFIFQLKDVSNILVFNQIQDSKKLHFQTHYNSLQLIKKFL